MECSYGGFSVFSHSPPTTLCTTKEAMPFSRRVSKDRRKHIDYTLRLVDLNLNIIGYELKSNIFWFL